MMKRFRVVIDTGLHTKDGLQGEVGFSYTYENKAGWVSIEALSPDGKTINIPLSEEAMDSLADSWLTMRELRESPPEPWVPSTREGWALWEQLHKERANGAQA